MGLEANIAQLREIAWSWDLFGLGSEGKEAAADEYDDLIEMAVELIDEGLSDAAAGEKMIEFVARDWMGFDYSDEPPMRLLTNQLDSAIRFVGGVRRYRDTA